MSLKFPSSEIAALQIVPLETDVVRLQERLICAKPEIEITPTFFGLLGVCGTLPLHKTESIVAQRRWNGDVAPFAFTNLLSHRLTVLYFQAWCKYRLETPRNLGSIDTLLPMMVALAGTRASAASDHQFSARYATLLSARPVAAHVVSNVLTDYFGVAISLEQFVHVQEKIPDLMRSRLGAQVSRLNYGAMLGARIGRRDRCIRLNIGPLAVDDFERFLPRGMAALDLEKKIRLFSLPDQAIEVCIHLLPSCRRPLRLHSSAGLGQRLGWDACLLGASGRVKKTSITYVI